MEPLVSIAIPSFNRPRQLTECLEAIEQEVATCTPGVVEVCIVDDASTDPRTWEVLGDFADRHGYVTLVRNPKNLGLERNLIEACRPCRGDYVWIHGNDDRLVPGSLGVVVGDLRSGRAPVQLYEKLRIDRDGRGIDPIPGSSPVALSAGDGVCFEALLEPVAGNGMLSTFGFISQVIVEREPFLAEDPEPFLGLTMYAQVFMLVAAFGDRPVQYRNHPIVFHRTPQPVQKHAEALGRREEPFMQGGPSRSARYFGTTLAAGLWRLAARTGLDVGTMAAWPERLMTDQRLLDWVVSNRAIDPGIDETLPPGVVVDADRFLECSTLTGTATGIAVNRLDDVGRPVGVMAPLASSREQDDSAGIRLAAPVDRWGIACLIAGNWGGRDHLARKLEEWVADTGSGVLVATHDGVIVGTVRVANPSLGAWWLEGLRVDPDSRRRGVGRQLWNAVIELADGVQRALGRPGTLHVFSDVGNDALWRLAEGSGCTELGRFVRLVAPALEGASVDRLVPLDADAIVEAMGWLNRSADFAAIQRLTMGRPVAGRVIDEGRLAALVGAGRVRRSPTRVADGLVILDPPGDGAIDSLTISYLDAPPCRISWLARATRRLAAELGVDEVTVLTIAEPNRLDALGQAGFRPLPGGRGRGVLFGRAVGQSTAR